MPEITPDTTDPRPALNALAGRLSGFIKSADQQARAALIPNEDTRKKPHQMEQGQRDQCLSRVRRMEYLLRCFILWLAAQLIARAHSSHEFAANLKTCLGFKAAARDDVQGPPAWMVREDKILREDLSGEVRLNSFSIATPQIISARRSATLRRPRPYRLLDDPLRAVDARHVLARIARLPRLLKRADKLAERIAARALGQVSDVQGLAYQPLKHWLPPEDIWRDCQDESEREDLNSLHYRAYSALSDLRVFPNGLGSDTPGFARFKPPDRPQLRHMV